MSMLSEPSINVKITLGAKSNDISNEKLIKLDSQINKSLEISERNKKELYNIKKLISDKFQKNTANLNPIEKEYKKLNECNLYIFGCLKKYKNMIKKKSINKSFYKEILSCCSLVNLMNNNIRKLDVSIKNNNSKFQSNWKYDITDLKKKFFS